MDAMATSYANPSARNLINRIAMLAGVNKEQAARVVACLEVGQAYRAAPDAPIITRPAEAHALLAPMFRGRKTESLMGIYLDANSRVLRVETISSGSVNTVRSHPREIFYPAITSLALGMVLAHNHPSGNLEPSDDDIQFTRVAAKAGNLLGIEVYDHIIVAGDGYTSLANRGLMA